MNSETEDVPSASSGMSALTLCAIFSGGIFTLLLLYACAVAAFVIVPIVVAFMLKLIFQPLTSRMNKLRSPKILTAFFIIALLFGGFAGLATMLSGPATIWASEITKDLPELKEKIVSLQAPIRPLQNIFHGADTFAISSSSKIMTVSLAGSKPSDRFMAGTRNFGIGVFETLLILFFMLISGDTFLRRLVEILPNFKDKKRAVMISNKIEEDISIYLVTITGMNALVGITTAAAMAWLGVQDPVLWGALAFLLNYIPIAGPLIATILFLVIGTISQDGLIPGLLPAGIYFSLHIIEAQAITPLLLAKHFVLNPVLVILFLVFWYWMWGVPGALLSTPMLAIIKIICDHVDALMPVGHFIQGDEISNPEKLAANSHL